MKNETLREQSRGLNFEQLLSKKDSQCLQNINDFEAFVDSSAKIPLTNKVVLDIDYVYGFIEQFKKFLPKELEQAQIVLNEMHDIIDAAEQHSEELIEDAKNKSNYILSESRLLKEAEEQANLIIEDALINSETIKKDTESYVLEVLSSAEVNLFSVIDSVKQAKISVQETNEENVNL